jgi:RNA polymerase sigma factor (sigma-70 family)
MHESAGNAAGDVSTLVLGARRGDTESWDTLVDRFGPVVWAVTRSFGLSAADSAETIQTVWLRLAEHLDRIKYPDRVGAWLVTTARRECIRQLKLRNREDLGGSHEMERHLSGVASADAPVLMEERDAVVRRAFDQLPERSRTLLVMLLNDPPMSYNDISQALAIPIGSIGPTRARVLATLRKRVEEADISVAD